MKHNDEITLGGTRFRIEVVNANYRKLVPIVDPMWHLKFCELLCPRETNDDKK